MNVRIAALGWLTTLAVTGTAAAEPCADAANAVLKKRKDVAEARYLEVGSARLEPQQCSERICKLVYYADGSRAPKAAAPTAGFHLSPEHSDPSNWLPVPAGVAAGCATLVQLAYVPDSKPGVAGVPARSEPMESPIVSAQQVDGATLRQLRQLSRTVPSLELGHSEGLSEALASTAQILGQIVVDRASSEAFSLLKGRIEAALGCRAPRVFVATCPVVHTLRIQDIAMQRDALYSAILSDVYRALAASGAFRQPRRSAAADIAVEEIVATLASVVLPATHPSVVLGPQRARAVVDEVLALAGRVLPDGAARAAPGAPLNPGVPAGPTLGAPVPSAAREAVGAAAIAFAKCELNARELTRTGEHSNLADCDIGAFVDDLNMSHTSARPAARALAHALLSAATLLNDNKAPDARLRLIDAVDALLSTLCMLAVDEPTPVLSCGDAAALRRISNHYDALTVLQPVVLAALRRDSNAVLVASSHALRVTVAGLQEPANEDRYGQLVRALTLIGGVLNYGSTFTGDVDDSEEGQKAAHERRTKILESLTRDMTDRTGRDGDVILSLGGSLRAVAGYRVSVRDRDDDSFYGPVSLPLGLGLDALSRGSGPGFHAELGIIDLGEYLAFDSEHTVQEPELENALTPSATLAMAWGRSLPAFVGLTGSYSPTFVVDPDTGKRGSLQFGVTAGIYVPLLDAN